MEERGGRGGAATRESRGGCGAGTLRPKPTGGRAGGQTRSAPGRGAGSAEGGMAGGGCPGRLAPVLLLALLWPGRTAAEVSERRDGPVARGPAEAAAGPGAERVRPHWALVGKER